MKLPELRYWTSRAGVRRPGTNADSARTREHCPHEEEYMPEFPGWMNDGEIEMMKEAWRLINWLHQVRPIY